MSLLNFVTPRDRNNTSVADPTSMYKISDMIEDTVSYYGHVNHDGSWYIMKWNQSAGTFRYAAGKSSYSLNWTDRANLGYDYFDLIF
jgi:hypothetical protein